MWTCHGNTPAKNAVNSTEAAMWVYQERGASQCEPSSSTIIAFIYPLCRFYYKDGDLGTASETLLAAHEPDITLIPIEHIMSYHFFFIPSGGVLPRPPPMVPWCPPQCPRSPRFWCWQHWDWPSSCRALGHLGCHWACHWGSLQRREGQGAVAPGGAKILGQNIIETQISQMCAWIYIYNII